MDLTDVPLLGDCFASVEMRGIQDAHDKGSVIYIIGANKIQSRLESLGLF